MTIENTILLAKQEKTLNEAVNEILTSLDRVEASLLESVKELPEKDAKEVCELNLKHCPEVEELKKFDYMKKLSEIGRNGVKDLKEANKLVYILKSGDAEKILADKNELYKTVAAIRKLVEEALEKVNNGDKSGCEVLARVKVTLEK